jgi:hypothetical protein
LVLDARSLRPFSQPAKYKISAKIASANSNGCTITPPAIEITKSTMARISSTHVGYPRSQATNLCILSRKEETRLVVVMERGRAAESQRELSERFARNRGARAAVSHDPKLTRPAHPYALPTTGVSGARAPKQVEALFTRSMRRFVPLALENAQIALGRSGRISTSRGWGRLDFRHAS